MKEINEAYDQIMKERSGTSSNQGGTVPDTAHSLETPMVDQAYMLECASTLQRNIAQTEQLLNSVPDRNAEWYFLTGAVIIKGMV